MKNNPLFRPRTLLVLAAGYAIYTAIKKSNEKIRINGIDYGDQFTYVIGHKSPDADSVGSAIAYAKLLNELGIKAKAVTAGPLNNETKYFLEKYELPVPEIIEEAQGKQFVLVDHATYLQAINGMKDARVLSVIDHHKECDFDNKEVPFMKLTSAGATASLIHQLFNEYGITIDKDTARVLLMAILSDTKNLKKVGTNYLDRSAYRHLLPISEIEDPDSVYKEMIEASMVYDGLSDRQILHSDLKIYETKGVKYCIAMVRGKNHDEMISLIDRMYDEAVSEYDEMGLDYIFLKVKDSETGKMYMRAYGKDAVELLDNIYFNYDGSKYFIFEVSLSRKMNLVPMIDLAIIERKN